MLQQTQQQQLSAVAAAAAAAAAADFSGRLQHQHQHFRDLRYEHLSRWMYSELTERSPKTRWIPSRT
jgi:hypothetical protein